MTDRRRAPHPLSIFHLLAMLGLLAWWAWYFWEHTPARSLPPATSGRRNPAASSIGAGATVKFGEGMSRAVALTRAAVIDIAGGLSVLVLFAVGTGVYVRRLEIWLQARGSGAAISLAGTGLSEKALAANANRGNRR